MSIVKDVLFPAAFGVAIAVIGFSVITWQYWLVFGLASAWRLLPDKKEVIR